MVGAETGQKGGSMFATISRAALSLYSFIPFGKNSHYRVFVVVVVCLFVCFSFFVVAVLLSEDGWMCIII